MSALIKFLKEVQEQFNSITWPTKDTLIQLTFVVISISIVISLILGGFDYLFTTSFGLLGKIGNHPIPVESIPLDVVVPTLPQDEDYPTETTSAQPLPDIQNLGN